MILIFVYSNKKGVFLLQRSFLDGDSARMAVSKATPLGLALQLLLRTIYTSIITNEGKGRNKLAPMTYRQLPENAA